MQFSLVLMHVGGLVHAAPWASIFSSGLELVSTMNEEGAQSLGTATTGRPAATAAKSCGEWKIVCLHLSSNVFTNTLIAELTRTFWYAGGAALLIGGLAGWFLGRRRAKRSRG